MEEINKIIQFILEPDVTGWLLAIKIIFLVFGVIFLVFIVWALVKTTWLKRIILQDLKEFLTYRPSGARKVTKKWEKIKKRLDAGSEPEAKLALIEANLLLDKILKGMGYSGESLGERLDQLTVDILPEIEDVRWAHKIKSDIIHDPAYKLNLEEAKKALEIYKKALIELDVL